MVLHEYCLQMVIHVQETNKFFREDIIAADKIPGVRLQLVFIIAGLGDVPEAAFGHQGHLVIIIKNDPLMLGYAEIL